MGMRVRFTAEVIDENGNIISRQVGEGDGMPNIDDIDLSTLDGFKRDFDAVEKSILEASNKARGSIAEAVYETAKKNGSTQRKKEQP